MKFLIFLILSPTLFAKPTSVIKSDEDSFRPKNLKKFDIQLQSSFQTNPGKVDQDLAESRGFDSRNIRSESIGINLETKWLFKPAKKLILLDTFSINTLFYSSQADRLPFKDQIEVTNDLVGVYILNKKNQLGNLLRTTFNQGNSFQISDRPSIQELNQTHYMIQDVMFYQYKFNKTFSSRLNLGGKLTDYEDSYSSFTGASGEQNDHLAAIISIDNQFKINKRVNLKLPLSYRREIYKNRIALTSEGAFNTTSPVKERDTLEVYEIGAAVEIYFPEFQVTSSLTRVQQNDLVSGGRDFQGLRAGLELATQIDLLELKGTLAFNDFDYQSALVNPSDPNSENWEDKGYTLGFGAKYPVSEKMQLQLSAQKEVAEDNFFAGKFDNDIYQLGIEYRL